MIKKYRVTGGGRAWGEGLEADNVVTGYEFDILDNPILAGKKARIAKVEPYVPPKLPGYPAGEGLDILDVEVLPSPEEQTS